MSDEKTEPGAEQPVAPIAEATGVPIDRYGFGVDGNPPNCVVIQLPIKLWAEDIEDGMALLHGKMKQAESQAARVLLDMRAAKAKQGLIKPGPARADLGVVN